MVTKSVPVRFYLAVKDPSAGGFAWPVDPPLRAMLRSGLPSPGATGVSVKHNGEDFLVESSPTSTKALVHSMISTELSEVPSIQEAGKTKAMTLAAGQIPASMCHLVVLPSGVVATVRGVTAPGPVQCGAILSKVTKVPVYLVPLTRFDQMQVLNNSVSASSIELVVSSVDPSVAAGDPVLTAAAILAPLQGYRATIKLVATTRQERASLRSFTTKVLSEWMAGRLGLEKAKAQVRTAAGSQFDSKLVDLLQDQITERRDVHLSQIGPLSTLRPPEVLSAMRDAYNDLLLVIGTTLAATPTDFSADR